MDAILKSVSPGGKEYQLDRSAVKDAVEYSLDTGFRAFVQSIDQAGLTEEVELELDVEILKRVTKISRGVEATERRHQNEHFTIQEEPDTVTEADSATLIGVPEPSAEFIQLPSLGDVEYETSRIVVGKKGAGKSRTLAYLISEVCERAAVDYLVNLEDSFRVDDIEDILIKGLDGTVLLVFGDVHRLEGPRNIHPFRRLVKRLQYVCDVSAPSLCNG